MRPATNLLLLSSGIDSPCIRPALPGWVGASRSAVIVTTASREHKERSKHAVATRINFLSLGLEQVDFVDVEFEDASPLFRYDVVYIVGGHPFYLMHHLRLSGADAVLREINARGQALIIGSSAGAVVLGPDLRIVEAFDPELATGYEDFTGIGLVPFTILPHTNRWRERLPDFDERIQAFTGGTGLTLKMIDDGEALSAGVDGVPTEWRV